MTTNEDMERRACQFDATRTSPFGYYATCRCGYVTTEYRESHESAYRLYVAEHAAA